jgi:methylphosphotriester-DNA--protein-cysteine methyltransferase
MEPTQENIQILKKARKACQACGLRYGERCTGDATFSRGVCDVCDKLTAVTEADTFGFFYRGICNLNRRKSRIERESKRVTTSN